MQGTAHTMMISDIAMKCFCLRHIDMNAREIHSKRFMADIKIPFNISEVNVRHSKGFIPF